MSHPPNKRAPTRRQHHRRELSYEHEEDGSLCIRMRLPAEDGVLLLKTLEAAEQRRRERPEEAKPGPGLSTGDDSAES